MIDLVAGYAKGYTQDVIRPFLKSLRDTGYEGQVLLFADGGAALEAKKWDVDVRRLPVSSMKVHSARFLCLEEALRGPASCSGVLLTDTRDVVFQQNPTTFLPSQGLNVFEEDRSQTLGTCPYNSEWLKVGYGEAVWRGLSARPICCVGTTCGTLDAVRVYLQRLRAEVERIQSKTHLPQDQAAHNYLVYRDKTARVWPNEYGEVYTVGYLPRESVRVVGGKIVNQLGKVPAVIHQWDRHQNLIEHVRRLVE